MAHVRTEHHVFTCDNPKCDIVEEEEGVIYNRSPGQGEPLGVPFDWSVVTLDSNHREPRVRMELCETCAKTLHVLLTETGWHL